MTTSTGAFDTTYDHAKPLAETLKARARQTPHRVAYTFVDDRGDETTCLTFAQVDAAARAIAATLQATPGLAVGDRAVLCFPAGLAFTTAFWGCAYAGVVATPIAPPHPAMLAKELPRFIRMVADCAAKVLLTTGAYAASAKMDEWATVTTLVTDAMVSTVNYRDVGTTMDDVAFFQYSSGSTSDPKAVMISHGNIKAQMLTWMALVDPNDVMVSWLPHFHDMGLVVFTLVPISIGAHCVSMAPLSFVKDPTLWLRTVTKYKGTFICAPNFGYALAARKTSPDMVATLELVQVKKALCGAEPIRSDTLHEFTTAFQAAGFDPTSFNCGYGMAEATLAISFQNTLTPSNPTILKVQTRLLQEQQAIALAPMDCQDTRTFVGCGSLAPTFNLVVVAPESGKEVGEHHVGELWIQGPSVGQGYWNREELTKQMFGAIVESRGGVWFRTGDLGFVSNQELFITGRLKDLIIIRGRNIYPQDIELTVEQANNQVRPGCVAAFSVESTAHEEVVVVVCELQKDMKDDVMALTIIAQAISSAVNVDHRLLCDAVVLLKPRSIPKTTSGKIQRKATKEKYEHGQLAIQLIHRESNPPDEPMVEQDVTEFPNFETAVEAQLAQVWSDVLRVPIRDVTRESSIFRLGGDSLTIMQVAAECERRGLPASATRMYEEPVLWRAAHSLSSQVLSTDWPSVAVAEAVLDEIHRDWPRDSNEVYTTTPLQAAMIHATMTNPSAYVAQEMFVLGTSIDVDKLVGAFNTTVQQREILRTTFVTLPDGVFQVIQHSVDAVETIQGVDIHEFLRRDKSMGFEIGGPRFVRFTIFHAPTETYAVLTMHHALYDGWSRVMLMEDLSAAYRGDFLAPRPSFFSTVDYIQAQDKIKVELFWKSQMKEASTCIVAQIPVNEVDTEMNEPLSLESSLSHAAMISVAKMAGVTVAVLTKLAWAATLRKYTRQNDIIFGEVLANRTLPIYNADRIMGPLISTTPCRIQLDDATSVVSLLLKSQTESGEVMKYPYVSPHDMKKWCGTNDELFDTVFLMQHIPNFETTLNMDVARVHTRREIHTVDHAFKLTLEPTSNAFMVHAEFNPVRLSWMQAQEFLEEFNFTLFQLQDAVCTNNTLSSLWELSPKQLGLIKQSSIGICSPLPYVLLHHEFEARAKHHPDVRAVEFDGSWLSYGELDDIANIIAQTLVNLGVGVGCRVAVIMDRCLEFPLGLLSVLKAGAAIMPLDASFPVSRLKRVIQDAGAAVALTTTLRCSTLTAKSLGVHVEAICMNDLRQHVLESKFDLPVVSRATANSEAVVLFTSGSTGRPKGVVLLHKGVVNVITHRTREFGMTEGARVLQFLAIGFDMSQWEIWGALSNGATLVLRGENAFEALSTVDALICVPTGLGLLGDPSQYPKLKFVTLAGEPLPTSLKDLWAPVVQLTNCCGPSETTIISHSSLQQVDVNVNVGRPIPNMNCYVLDDKFRPVPIGVVGELFVGGIGVSPGYVNLPDETASKF
ncbi:hypothetical protein As57867_004967, partial [Aphanomyces stellatus]